jgi:predicted FMN-binding regulatory protein PaiB
MYIPNSFEVSALAKLSAVIHAHSFATLVSADDGSLFASHAREQSTHQLDH